MLFQHGELAQSQELAARCARRFQNINPYWSSRLRVLSAESAAWRGLDSEVLEALTSRPAAPLSPDIEIQRLSLLGSAHAHLHQFDETRREFAQAEKLCSDNHVRICGELWRAQAGFAIQRGRFQEAYQLYARSLLTARSFGSHWDESVAMTNLGVACLLQERFDEAIDWSHAASKLASTLGANDLLLNDDGNLGWAFYKLGDREQALDMFTQAEKRSIALGDSGGAITWLTTAGYVYQDDKDLNRAAQSYLQALTLARQINSKEDIVNSLESLIHVSIESGKLDQASTYLQQIDPLISANQNPLDTLDVNLARGKVAVLQRHDRQAQALLISVENDQQSQTSMRFGAQHALARLYALQGNLSAADRMYQTALGTFESQRALLKNEDSKLPFLLNATPVYDDYISFLITQHKSDQALAVADQSRARTLAQGLGLENKLIAASMHPEQIAKKSGATLLFYWLGAKQSYLWAITRHETSLFLLPPERDITPLVERYRKALLGPDDAIDEPNEDGEALYRILVEPAKHLIAADSPVVILTDGALSQINFETLVVPDSHPHYWIEDVTLTSAPSLAMLGSSSSLEQLGQKLLLLGNAVSPSQDYPELPMARLEMQEIAKHFTAGNGTVFARQQANSIAYLTSAPQQYTYIHFVAHGVSSRSDPLDSAIILSRTNSTEESFKLYAREIIKHPIHARLVTISTCYGNGTRSYAGEGLVGLSWAFLRAGAHNVIGALWEASDQSTPRLMDALYQGLHDGLPPSVALRQAKLSLLHSQVNFRKPFFWAPFQLYTGL